MLPKIEPDSAASAVPAREEPVHSELHAVYILLCMLPHVSLRKSSLHMPAYVCRCICPAMSAAVYARLCLPLYMPAMSAAVICPLRYVALCVVA